MMELMVWVLFSTFYFVRAYRVKNNEKSREVYLKNTRMNDKGRLVVFLRNYNSKVGYLRYSYMSNLSIAFFGAIYGLISYVSKNPSGIQISSVLIFCLLADFIIYRSCKNI